MFGAYYSNPGHRGLELDAVEEERTEGGRYRRGGCAGGGRAAGSDMALSVEVRRSCSAGQETVFAFGLLRRRHDSVTAERRAFRKRLSTVPIPASLHAGGVLVYGALGSGGANIIAQRPSGAVDEEQSFISAPLADCRPTPHP